MLASGFGIIAARMDVASHFRAPPPSMLQRRSIIRAKYVELSSAMVASMTVSSSVLSHMVEKLASAATFLPSGIRHALTMLALMRGITISGLCLGFMSGSMYQYLPASGTVLSGPLVLTADNPGMYLLLPPGELTL